MAVNRKMAYIDLSQKKVKINKIPADARRKFLSGRGFSAYLLFKHLPKGSDPLGPANVIIISSGLLDGTGAGPFECIGIATKSPLTRRCGFAPVAGYFAGEMRWADFDHLVITGKAQRPVYLHIHDGKIEFKNAENLKGKTASESMALIRNELKDENIRALLVGPAGENRVGFANIATDCGRLTGRTGLGAVFGSKNIKAIVVRGTGDIVVKHPLDLLGCYKEILDRLSDEINAPHGPIASEGIQMPARDLTLTSSWAADNDSEMVLPRLIAEAGLDLFSTRCILEWAWRLSEKGVIPQRKIRGIPFNRKDPQANAELVKRIAARKGIGAILALGPWGAIKKLGSESLTCFPSVTHLIRMHTDEAVNPTAPGQSEIYFPQTDELARQKDRLGEKTARRVADPLETGSIDQQMLCRVSLSEMSEMVANCLGFGRFDFYERAFGLSPFSMYGKLLDLVAGIAVNADDLAKLACRSYAVERLLNIRETSVNGASASVIDGLDVPAGLRLTKSDWEKLDLNRFQRLVGQYYREKGWDKKTMVKLKTFKSLGIDELWPMMK